VSLNGLLRPDAPLKTLSQYPAPTLMIAKTIKPKMYPTSFSRHPAGTLAALIFVVLFAFSEGAVFAQEPQPSATPAQEPQTAQEPPDTPKIPNGQLDSLVAPIALYPDPLLSQVLVSSTYPLELVQLQQWAQLAEYRQEDGVIQPGQDLASD
jgi:Protein of unknown function (DUF3300)